MLLLIFLYPLLLAFYQASLNNLKPGNNIYNNNSKRELLHVIKINERNILKKSNIFLQKLTIALKKIDALNYVSVLEMPLVKRIRNFALISDADSRIRFRNFVLLFFIAHA